MTNNYLPETRQPSIVKYSQNERSGVVSHTHTRHAIGFVVRGHKLIFNGDTGHQVNQGDLFYLSTGNHYIEDIPDSNRSFEQIVVYFTPEQLSQALSTLSINFGLRIAGHHSCENCSGKKYVIYPAWKTMHNYFATLKQYLGDEITAVDSTAEKLKMTELTYLIVSNPDCCIRSRIMEQIDSEKESFEEIVQNNIFNDLSIEELARMSNRSTTSFKKEFKKHYFESPHKWFTRQRLMHARIVLISTGKSVAEIGQECNFPNTSHFIKLFRQEFGMTPSVYRHRHREDKLEYNAER